MGKVIGKIFKAVAVVALVVGTAGAAGVFGAAAAFSVAGLSAATILTVGAVASTLGTLLDPPNTPDINDLSAHSRITLNTRTDPNAPRTLLFGDFGVGGVIEYQEDIEIGAEEDPNHLWLVIALGGHEINSISDTIQFGGEEITFTGSTPAAGKYKDFLFMWKHLGTDDQIADANLETATAAWTSDHRLRGVPYVVIKIIADPDVFENGILPFKFSGEGMKLYDPRLDTTVGGAGTQRFDDKSTYVYSQNSALANLMYRRGVDVGGTIIAGMALPASRFDFAQEIAEANACDEAVALAAGGTEPRYECNGVVDPRNNHATCLTNISVSMAGVTIVQSGVWRSYAGVVRAAVKSRSRDDALGGVAYQAHKAKETRYNGVKGDYISADDLYNLTPIAPYLDATFLTEDNGQERFLNISFGTITSVTQGQRVHRIILNRTRMEKQVSFQTDAVSLQDTVMDNLLYTHAGYNLSDLKMVVSDWSMRFQGQGFFFDVTYIEEDDDIYAWSTTDELRFATATPQALSTAARLPADRTIGPTGTIGDTVYNRVDVALETDGSRLAAGLSVNQGDDLSRSLTIGGAYNEAADGDTITYSTPWTSNDLPSVIFGAGGISGSSTLTAPYGHEFIALSASTTGFTMKARLKELLTGTSTITDTGATEISAGIIYDMDKSVIAEAVDNVYTYQFDVTITNNIIIHEDGSVTIGLYTNDGGGFIQRDTIRYFGDEFSDGASTTLNNQTFSINVDGLGQIAGKEFRIVLETSGFGGTIDAFDSVVYLTGSAPADETATPSGARPIQWYLQGGNESGV